MNYAHEDINFTIEKENNDELAFLEVQVKQKENKFLILVYRKNFSIKILTTTSFFLDKLFSIS